MSCDMVAATVHHTYPVLSIEYNSLTSDTRNDTNQAYNEQYESISSYLHPPGVRGHLKSAGRLLRVLVATVTVLAAICSTGAASPTHTSPAARRRLLKSILGVEKISTQHVTTTRSQLIKKQPDGFIASQQLTEMESLLEQRSTAGLNIHFFYSLDSSRTAAEVDYIKNKLMPATATVLARSIRVRQPSGLLPLPGYPDESGKPIPGPPEGIDADIVLKVSSKPANSELCQGVLAGAFAYLVEDETLRPVYGLLELCQINPNDFAGDLSTTVHEVLHALVMDQDMFGNYPGYKNKGEVMTQFDNGRSVVTTPNVLKSITQHFDCDRMYGAELEDDGGRGTAGSHWEQRIFEGEMMDGVGGLPDSHHFRHVLTNVTLGLLQDSNWYDVKYGSGGHNVFGYQGGCEFSLGNHAEAMQAPNAARYLCKKAERNTLDCLPDYSGEGICYRSELWDGFFRSQPVARGNFDCMSEDGLRGQRCISMTANDKRMCIDMKCSASGELLVAGEPCDSEVYECPDNDFMCKDPGLLTCLGDLNDCSGKGDCLMGNCYCHTGYGGADCSVPACIATLGCEDGTACPESGFCGVEACGTWSSGPLDQGVPCKGAVGPPAPPSAPPAPLPDIAAPVIGSNLTLETDSSPDVTDSVPDAARGADRGSSYSAINTGSGALLAALAAVIVLL